VDRSDVDETAPGVPTVRLWQVLATYCRDLHPAGLRGQDGQRYPQDQ
jgi:hypothetical protein